MTRPAKSVVLVTVVLAVLSAPRPLEGQATIAPTMDTRWLGDVAKAGTGGVSGSGAAIGWLQDAFGKGLKPGAEALDAYKPLSDGDKSLDPNYRPPGSPNVPSHCTAPDGKSSEGCNDCYAAAYRKLTAVRLALEKLRRVGTTTRAFTAKSIAFGDSVSGVHGVAGLGWQPERAKIEQSLRDFEKAYDSKHTELMGLLEAALKDIGQCEAKHFGQADWYDRYGFMYYTFMYDRYKGP